MNCLIFPAFLGFDLLIIINIYINIIKKSTNQFDAELLNNFKKLAIDLDKQINQFLEEAMRNMLKNNEINKSNKFAVSSPALLF